MKLGSCSKINQETVSDYLWAGVTAAGKSKVPSLCPKAVFSQPQGLTVWGGAGGSGSLYRGRGLRWAL